MAPKPKATLTARIDRELKDTLIIRAGIERRTLSNLVEILIEEAIVKRSEEQVSA